MEDYNELFDDSGRYVDFYFASGSAGNSTLNHILDKSNKEVYDFVKEVCELVDKYPAIPFDYSHELLRDIVFLDPSANITDAYEGPFIDRLQIMLIKNKEVITEGVGKHYGITEEFFEDNVYNKGNLRNCMKDEENPMADYINSELWNARNPINRHMGFEYKD